MRESGPDPDVPAVNPPRRIRGYAEVEHDTESRILEQVVEQRASLERRLASVGALLAIASGKGGVGKSAITANLAVALADRGARVGVVDADLNGPSLGRMLGLAELKSLDEAGGIAPPSGAAGVVGMSTELLLEQDAALRLRGPASDRFVWQGVGEAGVLREFLADVVWGELDYLLVDIPPGTDKIARFLDLVPQPAQVLLVTIPSRVAVSVVARSASLLRDAGVPSVGLVGNMCAYSPREGEDPVPLFSAEGVEELAETTGLELWAEIPFDPELGRRTDGGDPPGAREGTGAGRALGELAERVERGPLGRGARP